MADITKHIRNMEIPYFGLGGCAVVYKADFVKEGVVSQQIKVKLIEPFRILLCAEQMSRLL